MCKAPLNTGEREGVLIPGGKLPRGGQGKGPERVRMDPLNRKSRSCNGNDHNIY